MGSSCSCPVPPAAASAQECKSCQNNVNPAVAVATALACGVFTGHGEAFPYLPPASELTVAPGERQDGDICVPKTTTLAGIAAKAGHAAEQVHLLRHHPHVPIGLYKASGASCAADLSARHAAYVQRKNRRKAIPKGAPGTANAKFLSGLPEVEADIAYRFNFSVLGDQADFVVAGACASKAAQSLPGVQGNRCLCSVGSALPSTPGGPSGAQDTRLAKLVFNVVGSGECVPPCKSRLEASSTVVVSILVLDVGGDPEYLELQLRDAVERAERSLVDNFSPQPRRALLLCYEDGAESSWPDRRWESVLDNFETQYGKTWKLGPVRMADADALHRTFAEMACSRIICEQTRSGREPAGEGEQDDDGTLSVSHAWSSQGFVESQRPPVFEAECNSDDCLEDAIGEHISTHSKKR